MLVGGISGGLYRFENGEKKIIKIWGVKIFQGNWKKIGTNSLCKNCGEFYISSITAHPKISDQIYITISSFGDSHLV